MPSEMKVNKISPASGTDVTLGDSGDTFTIPSGATITNSGTQNGFGSTSASDLSSGTLPMARLSGTLPALNGSALTALNGSNIASGTVAAARLPSLGAWTLIGTNAASNSASLTQTGLDSTYDTYAIVVSDIVPVTDTASLELRMGDSSGIDSGGSDYSYHSQKVTATSTSYATNISAGADNIHLIQNLGTAAGEGAGGVWYLVRPGDGSTRPMITGTVNSIDSGTVMCGGATMGSRNAVITLDRVQIIMSSGNIASGRMTVYGIAHT